MQGSITKRGDGVYLIRLSIGYRTLPDGRRKRHYKSVTVHGTKKEAERRRRELVAQFESGGVVDQDMTPLLDYLLEWLELTKGGLAANTKRGYLHHIRDKLGPAIGALPLSRVTAMDIQRLYADISNRFSYSTLNTCDTILRQAFRQAVRWRRIAYNPVNDVDKPRKKAGRGVQKHFDREHLATFLHQLKSEHDGILYRLMFFSGLRPGESLALTWPCVDWVAGGILVRAKVLKETGQPARLDVTKTAAGERFIPLPDYIMSELKAHRLRVLEARMAAGPTWDTTYDLVFPNFTTGRLRSLTWPNTRVKQLYAKYDMPVLVLYALRHSFATAHFLGHQAAKTVSALMGHSGTQVTTNTYTHYHDEMGRQAADQLGELFRSDGD